MKLRFILLVLLGLAAAQVYEDCEVWLYRARPNLDNIFDPVIASEVLSGSQESFDTIYHRMTRFRYFAFQNCRFDTTYCNAYVNKDDAEAVPYGMPQNDYLYTSPYCANNFTLLCNVRQE